MKFAAYKFRDMTVPFDVIENIYAFVHQGRPTGGFLEACIDNNLHQACALADENNIKIIPAIVAYLYNEAPAGCWGYDGAHDDWIERCREAREKRNADLKELKELDAQKFGDSL